MNDAQRAAATADIAAPLLIVAGAGSGKTLTMVRRIEHIIKVSGCRPREVLAITFTRNACDEMKARLRRLLGHAVASNVVVLTIHSFCLRVLRRHLQELGGSFTYSGNDFTIASKREQVLMIEEACDSYDVSQSRPPSEDPKMRSSRAKRLLTKVLQLRAKGVKAEDLTSHERGGELRYCCEYYARTLEESASLDFHDLVEKTTLLLETVPSAAATIRRMHRYVLVDEFQDVSTPQFSFLKALIGPENGSVTAVGDDDQSIYSFQGACVGNFQHFEKHFESRRCATVRLEQNYRSSGIIVAAANSVIDKNKQRLSKTLFTDKGRGEKVSVCECRHAGCEIAFVLNELQRRHSPPPNSTNTNNQRGDAKSNAGVPWHQMAILYRTNAVGATFQEALRKSAIPFTVSGEHLYSPLEVDDVLSLLRFAIHGHHDNQALLRVAKILRAPLPSEVYCALKNHAEAQRVSMLHACRWFLRHKGQVGNVCFTKDVTEKGSGRKNNSKSAAAAGNKKGTTSPKRGKSQILEVKKVVDFYDTIRLRLAELSLPSLVRRLVDSHPWVKQRMQQQQHASNSSGSGGSSSISGGGGGGGSNSSSSSSQVIYGDLGSALIREAEIFDATYVDEDEERDDDDDEFKAPFAKRRKKKSMQYDEDESEDPERAWREALGEDNDEEDENEVQEFDEDEEGQCEQDPAVVKRARKARAFLDHLIVATAEDAPIGGQNQGGNENHPVITASGKVLKRGHGMNKSGNSNTPAAAVEEPPVREAVFMGTVHQAKGLEWPIVFVVRFNEEEFPLAPRIDSDESSENPAAHPSSSNHHKSSSAAAFEKAFGEEERRLAYVALSRPQHSLIVSYVIQDQSSGGSAPPPSRFLKDIPTDLATRSDWFSDLTVNAAGSGAAGNTYAAAMAGAVADAKMDSSPGGSSFRTFTAAATSASASSSSSLLSSSTSSTFPAKKATKVTAPPRSSSSSSSQPWAAFVRNPSKQPVAVSSLSSLSSSSKPPPAAPVQSSAYLPPPPSHHKGSIINSAAPSSSSSSSSSSSVLQPVHSAPTKGMASFLKKQPQQSPPPPQQIPPPLQLQQQQQQQQPSQLQKPLTAQQLLAQRKRMEFLQAQEQRKQREALRQHQQSHMHLPPQVQPQQPRQEPRQKQEQDLLHRGTVKAQQSSSSMGSNRSTSSSSGWSTLNRSRGSNSGSRSSCSSSVRSSSVQNVHAGPKQADADVATTMAWDALPVLGETFLAQQAPSSSSSSSSNVPAFSDD